MPHSTRHAALAATALTLLAVPLFAQGGPPVITDDPDTPGPGHWEINLSLFRERTHHEKRTEEPRIDANYGLGRRIQLKLEGPWVALHTDSGRATGLGDATAGVKWRFLGQEHQRIAWSVYPQYEFSPSESSRRRAWPAKAGLGKRLELLGEVHGVHPDGEETELVLNGGARGKLTRQVTLMLAVGHAVRGGDERRRLLVYAGVQLNLPDTFDFDAAERAARQASRRD